jgi:catechol 2,3-dioxygenase-like lactoylglutathione lyase family enzyme
MVIDRNSPESDTCGETLRGSQIERRSILGMLGLAIIPGFAVRLCAQGGTEVAPMELPLKVKTICGHCGISVPDVTTSALFYSKVFGGANVRGEKHPSLRYIINLAGNAGVPGSGSVAIGKLGTLGGQGKTEALIDHFCINAEPYNDAAWRSRLKAEGLTYYSNGVFGDINGIFVQVSGAQGGESLSVGPVEHLDSLYTGEPLLRSDGYDHIMLHVSSLDESVTFYQKMFGLRESSRKSGVVYFSDGETRLALKQVAEGEKANIPYYAVKVPNLDHSKITNGLKALGASVLPAAESKDAIRFADPDGVVVELWPT